MLDASELSKILAMYCRVQIIDNASIIFNRMYTRVLDMLAVLSIKYILSSDAQ